MNAPATSLAATDDARRPEALEIRSLPCQSAPSGGPRATSLVFYRACAAALEHEQVIWDVGCGDGNGAALLCAEGRRVFGFEWDSQLVGAARSVAPAAMFAQSFPPLVAGENAPDVIVLGDVLGYVQEPEALLLTLSVHSKPTTQLWLWEPRAEPTQQLAFPKRRAYSAVELRELAAVSGWQKHSAPQVCPNTTVLLATRAPTGLVQTLSKLHARSPEAEPVALGKLPPDLEAAVHVRRAVLALEAKDGNAATRHFLAALSLTPQNSLALSGLAHIALSCGSLTDATQLLSTCLELDPTNIQALELWAAVLESTKPDSCLTTYQTIANLNPADATVASALAQLHAQAGDPLLAIQDLERLRRYHAAPNVGLSLTLGWLLLSVGRKSDAEVEARLAELLDPDGPEVQQLMAQLVV